VSRMAMLLPSMGQISNNNCFLLLTKAGMWQPQLHGTASTELSVALTRHVGNRGELEGDGH
jgi:hypothetical protein